MTEDEWGYWMEGKAAKGDIKAPDGSVMEKAGAGARRRLVRRPHGPRPSCWNSVMDEDRYNGLEVERVHRGVTDTTVRATIMAGSRASAGPALPHRRQRMFTGVAPYLQAAPLAIILAVFLLIPSSTIVIVSFWDYDFSHLIPASSSPTTSRRYLPSSPGRRISTR